MINLARQAFSNPFQTVGSSFQPGAFGSVGRCPLCGNAVAIGGTLQSQTAGFNPVGIGGTGGQQVGGPVPTPYAISQGTGFGQINPLAAQFGGINAGINPMVAQLGNWPVSAHLSHQGVGGRTGAYGIDPRYAFGTGQQFGLPDPNVVAGLNPSIGGDPISSLLSQQWNPLAQQQLQQQLPIRPLIAGQQGLGSQSFVPGFASPATQWADPYRAFIEAQLISQLANNPLYQLQRAYGGVPEFTGLGMPFAGQQFNPLLSNVPFYG
jgi:hypothetical protein